MIDLRFVMQCLRRRWWLVLLCAALAAVGGGAWAMLSDEDEEPLPPFTAEATIYMNGYDSSDTSEYNYRVDESYLVSDARRIVVSDSVAGEVRRIYGDEVVVSSPFWKNPDTEATFYTHFIFVDASAESADVAVDAANMAAELAVEKMQEQISVEVAEIYEPAVLKTVVGKAADFGADSMDPDDLQDEVESEGSGSILKTIFVSGFCAAALAFAIIVAYYYVNRRFRTAHDIERILGVPVLGSISANGVMSGLKEAFIPVVIDEVCNRNKIDKIAVCGMPQGEYSDLVQQSLEELCDTRVIGQLDFSCSAGSKELIEEAGCLVLVVLQDAADSSQIAKDTKMLNFLEIPVIGAIFVESGNVTVE